MPRHSPYSMVLSDAEYRELTRRATTYALPYFQVQHTRMILLAAQGWPNHEIVVRLARQTGLVATISGSTVWRWLHEAAIRPWQHRCWIFPRVPEFARNAGRILDLYEGAWNGQPLRDDEFVLSADENTSIQARSRPHPTLAAQPGSPMKLEHQYERCGAWA